jgi:hypothetical protein
MSELMTSSGLSDRTLGQLEERRQRILNGGVNCIPSPFTRFLDDFCGIEQSNYYVITSFTKGGKSQFTSFTFIYRTVIYSYFTKEDLDFRIIYFNLEETKERIMQRFMSWLLYRFTHGKMRVSPKELRSTSSAVDEAVLDRLAQEDIQDILKYFEEHVIFPTEAPNPTGIYKFCKQYAEDHGTVNTRKVTIKDELGQPQEVVAFDSYEQDNPNEYRMIIVDTINLIDTERGMKLKESMDKLSEYEAKYLRNRYHYTIVNIQQQAFESEGNESFKLGRVRPSAVGLGDSKYTSRDANVVMGLFSPFRFGITEYLGYDITILKDRIRFLEMITNRDGEMGGIIALWFDGAVCDFRELPKPDDKAALDKYYKECKRLDALKNLPSPSNAASNSQATSAAPVLLLSMKNSIKRFINFTF